MDKLNFEDGDPIIMAHEKIGFIRGWAAQDFSLSPGSSSIFKARITDAPQLPGVHEMTVNSNHWTIYHEKDPDVQFLIVAEYFKEMKK